MKKFYMLRHEDISGNSGTGVVAEGIIFDDGTGAMTWLSSIKTVTTFWKISDIKKMHGHEGKTEIIIEGAKKFIECQEKVKEIKIKNKSNKRLLGNSI